MLIKADPYDYPFDGDLRPSNTALLAIDMQFDFCGEGGYVLYCVSACGKGLRLGCQPPYVQGATNDRRRYRYYVSKCLVDCFAGDSGKGWRLPAPELDRAVASAARHILSDRAGLLEAVKNREGNRFFYSQRQCGPKAGSLQ